MLGRGETIEIPLFHMMWEEGKHAGKRIGLHACIINSEEENIHVAGVKAIPSTPANPRELGKPRSNGLVELFDEETGYPIAVVDDTLISGMRTGADSGLGAKCFAREDSEVVGLIGSGIIAGYCLESTAMSMKNIKKVKIYDLILENAQRFCEKFAHLGYEFEVVDSAEKTIRDSDIVHTCSLVDVGEEYVEPDWMKPSSFHSFVSQYDYKEACHLLPNVSSAWTGRTTSMTGIPVPWPTWCWMARWSDLRSLRSAMCFLSSSPAVLTPMISICLLPSG